MQCKCGHKLFIIEDIIKTEPIEIGRYKKYCCLKCQRVSLASRDNGSWELIDWSDPRSDSILQKYNDKQPLPNRR